MIRFDDLVPHKGYVIGEIACGHGGDICKLLQLIDVVAESGAQIVKFQVFTLEERAIPGEDAWNIFAKLELTEHQWRQAIHHARELGLSIISDVFGYKSLRLATELGVDGYKIHSEDLLNSYFIAEVAVLGKPVIIGIGGAHRSEIYNLLNFLKCKNLLGQTILMTGVQTFPTPIEAHSLDEVSDLSVKYASLGVKIGFSDHIDGGCEEAYTVPLMALAKGACVIEKHITINREDKWTDYQSALSKVGFCKFVQSIRTLAPLLRPVGILNEHERQYRRMFKKSPFMRRNLPKGHVIHQNDIEYKKDPVNAIPVSSAGVVGQQLTGNMSAGALCRYSTLNSKVGAIIVVRCSSSRLPNKAMMKICGRESIALVIDRVKRCQSVDCIVLATSTDPSDNLLAQIAQREGIPVFRGSLDNVASRYYEAATAHRLDHFVRITGDAILCDEVMIDKAVKSHLKHCCDVTLMTNMPFGTGKEVVSINAIKTILDTAVIPSNTEYLEYYLENERYFSIHHVTSDYDFDPCLRITLDYQEDFDFFSRVYAHFADINPYFTLADALAWLKKNPEVAQINMHKKQKYLNFDVDTQLTI
ncbi:MAG: NeuB family protein [Nitrospiraceae bacterium]|nr:NeuB family protein [Nitrospiraceae bacterium]